MRTLLLRCRLEAAAVQHSADAVLLCGDFNLTLYSYISSGALPLHGLDRRGISGQRGPCTATDVMTRIVGSVRHQGVNTCHVCYASSHWCIVCAQWCAVCAVK
jgi:hypothetical protein